MRAIRISLAEGAVLLLLASLFILYFALVNQGQRAREVVLDRASENASTLLNFAATAHIQYTDSVQAYASRSGIEFTMDPEANPDSIRFPATFSRILTEEFSDSYPDTVFKIYSRFPFGGDRERDLDDFALDALSRLEENPNERVHRIDEAENDSRIVRYAAPIIMREGCVACHNSPQWDIAKHDWKVGDVRGVREVSITVPSTDLMSRSEMLTLFGLPLLSCGLGVFFVYPAVRREVQKRDYFRTLSDTLGVEAKRSKREALTDGLTGLGNRRFFDRTLELWAQDCLQSQSDLALVILDIDHFKSVNDQFGHAAGDIVIKALGRILSHNLRPQDCAARIGGEEFAILCPRTSLVDVLDIVERIRDLVSAKRFEEDGIAFGITVSAGLTLMNPAEDHLAFFKRADALLYQAKNQGRDQSCWRAAA